MKKKGEIDEYQFKKKFPDAQSHIANLFEVEYITIDPEVQDIHGKDGMLMSVYSISDKGLLYIENCKEKMFLKTRNGLLGYVAGFVSGVLGTVLAMWIAQKLGIN